ncbi:MAG: hypothetical protein AB3P25_00595, partial [Candidatus Liberibacter psyllaurous]
THPFFYLTRRSSRTAHQKFAIDMSIESSNPCLKLSRFELIGRRDKFRKKMSFMSKNVILFCVTHPFSSLLIVA